MALGFLRPGPQRLGAGGGERGAGGGAASSADLGAGAAGGWSLKHGWRRWDGRAGRKKGWWGKGSALRPRGR